MKSNGTTSYRRDSISGGRKDEPQLISGGTRKTYTCCPTSITPATLRTLSESFPRSHPYQTTAQKQSPTITPGWVESTSSTKEGMPTRWIDDLTSPGTNFFYFLLDAAIANSFLQMKAIGEMSYLWFRLVLGRQQINSQTFNGSNNHPY